MKQHPPPPPPSDRDVMAWLRNHPFPTDSRDQAVHVKACVKAFPGVTPGQYASLLGMLMLDRRAEEAGEAPFCWEGFAMKQ